MKIGKTTFEWKGYSYRLTGFYFAYFSKEGRLMECVLCSESNANSVSGVGISGCIAPLSEIRILEGVIPHNGFVHEEHDYLERLKNLSDNNAIEILKSYKPNMSSRGFKVSRTRRENKHVELWLNSL